MGKRLLCVLLATALAACTPDTEEKSSVSLAPVTNKPTADDAFADDPVYHEGLRRHGVEAGGESAPPDADGAERLREASRDSQALRKALMGSVLVWQGKPARLPHHESVVAVEVSGQLACSGVLVAPDAVLTAAHCFCAGKSFMPARATGVRLGEKVLQQPAIPTRAPHAIAFHRQGACRAQPPFPDLTLVLLATTVSAPVAEFADDTLPQPTDLVDLVGYGAKLKGGPYLGERLHGPAITVSPDCAGPPPPDQPRSARYGCRAPQDGLLEMVAGPSAPVGIDHRPEQLAADTCQGDSGGGAFVQRPSPPIKFVPKGGGVLGHGTKSPLLQLDDASLQAAGLGFLAPGYALAGIVSRGVTATSGCGKGSVHVRVTAPVRAWISATLTQHAARPASASDAERH